MKTRFRQPGCFDLEKVGFDIGAAERDTWSAFVGAGAFVEGDFVFASGIMATLKVDAGLIYRHPVHLNTMLSLYASHPCIKEADVLLYAPDGMRLFTQLLGRELSKPVANTIKPLGAKTKYEFEFESGEDARLARSANRPVITEDIVTTLGSVAGVRRLLAPDQNVHSLAMLLRGTVNPDFRHGLVDHYLLKRYIPTDKAEFRRLYPN